MIQIQSMCSSCGAEVDLTPADLLLLLPVEAEPRSRLTSRSTPGSGSAPRLVHDCTECGAICVRSIEWRLANLLQANDVAALPDLELVPAAPELHPEDPPTGPALTVDQIIELHRLLEQGNWFDELAATGSASVEPHDVSDV